MATITFYSLYDYNNGVLYDETFDLDLIGSAGELLVEISKWLEWLTDRCADGEIREEYIVADAEGVPAEYLGEYELDPAYFDFVRVADEIGYEAAAAGVSLGLGLDEMRDAYLGEYYSMVDYAWEHIEATGLLAGVPDSLQRYFDIEAYARDLSMKIHEVDGHFFSS